MFCYNKNHVLILQQGKNDLPIKDIVKNQKNSFYLYDLQGLRDWYRLFLSVTESQFEVFFAMKANFNRQILKVFLEEGAGVDVVSGGEASLAQSVGFPVKKIIFSGVGKSYIELTEALEKGFFQINVESFEELKRISEICKTKKTACSIGLRINPNIDFESHPYIKTGLTGHKFGFEEEEIAEVLKFIRSCKELRLKGLSMHLGSQIFNLDPLYQAILYLKGLYKDLKRQGFPLEFMDLGGGLGVDYASSDIEGEKLRLQEFGKGLKSLLKDFDGRLLMEPGRLLTARFGLLCSKIEYVKKSPSKNFVILVSGMNHFMRPALYSARHRILPMKEEPKKNQQKYDVVGPICETGDTMAKDYFLPQVQAGDWLAIADVGAYGFVMANRYNLQSPVYEICFDKGSQVF